MAGKKYIKEDTEKYYTPVKEEDKKYPWTNSWYKYWSYRPWMVKDDWTPLKKNGRKTWTRMKTEIDFASEMGQIMNWSTFWKKVIENEVNKKDWVKPNTPMTIIQACREMGYSYRNFSYYMSQYPEVKKKYELAKEARTNYMQELSDDLIEKALEWKLKKLTNKERVDYAFRLQEKTNSRYNPKTVVDATVETVDPNRSSDDILNDIADLIT